MELRERIDRAIENVIKNCPDKEQTFEICYLLDAYRDTLIAPMEAHEALQAAIIDPVLVAKYVKNYHRGILRAGELANLVRDIIAQG